MLTHTQWTVKSWNTDYVFINYWLDKHFSLWLNVISKCWPAANQNFNRIGVSKGDVIGRWESKTLANKIDFTSIKLKDSKRLGDSANFENPTETNSRRQNYRIVHQISKFGRETSFSICFVQFVAFSKDEKCHHFYAYETF